MDEKDKAEKTTPKHAITPAMEANKWKPGQSGNPNGRPKGSRSKFSEAFIDDFMAEWREGGAEALRVVRTTDPSTFLRVAASIIPKEFNVNDGENALERLLERYGNEELDRLIAGLCTLGASQKGAKGTDKEASPDQPDSVH